jgi:hypothetical protein
MANAVKGGTANVAAFVQQEMRAEPDTFCLVELDAKSAYDKLRVGVLVELLGYYAPETQAFAIGLLGDSMHTVGINGRAMAEVCNGVSQGGAASGAFWMLAQAHLLTLVKKDYEEAGKLVPSSVHFSDNTIVVAKDYIVALEGLEWGQALNAKSAELNLGIEYEVEAACYSGGGSRFLRENGPAVSGCRRRSLSTTAGGC